MQGHGQLDLLALPAQERAREPLEAGGGWAAFVNPSPERVYVGTMLLRDYLESSGMTEVIRLRELIFASDLSGFTSAYSPSGRRALHPGLMLGLIFFGIMEGKWSLRELERLARFDVRAWWLCGGVQPDHSTIGNFLNRFQEVLTEDYFVRLTRDLVRQLGIGAGEASADGTVLEAFSSRFRAIKLEAAEAALQEAEQALAASAQDSSLAQKREAARSAAATLGSRVAKSASRGKKAEQRICPGEPEAVLQPLKNKTFRPSYKPSALANSERLILGKDVNPSEENGSLAVMLEEHREIVGALPGRLLLDAGYQSLGVLSMCVDLCLDVLCPGGSGAGNQWERRSCKGEYGKSRFVYDEGNDAYICPAGKVLRRESQGKVSGLENVVYSCSDWRECGHHRECTKRKSCRRIRRYGSDAYKEAMAKVFENPRARKIYGRRQSEVEPVFSELRGVQRLDRFHRIGLKGAKLEWSLHCSAYNLRRTLRLEARAALCGIFVRTRDGIQILWAMIVISLRLKYWE